MCGCSCVSWGPNEKSNFLSNVDPRKHNHTALTLFSHRPDERHDSHEFADPALGNSNCIIIMCAFGTRL